MQTRNPLLKNTPSFYFVCLLIAFCLIHISSYANDQDTTAAAEFWLKANEFYNNKDYKSAALFYKLAADNYQLYQNREKEVTCRNSQGKSLRRNKEYDKALRMLNENLQVAIKYLGHNHHLIGETWYQAGLNYGSLGENNQAIHSMEQALQTWENQEDKTTLKIAKAHNNLGVFYRRNARFDKALDHYLKALNIYNQVLDSLNPHIASAYNNISIIYEGNGDYDQAMVYINEAINIAENNPKSSSAGTAKKYNTLGKIYMAKGDTVRAYENYRRALGLWLENPEQNFPDLAIVYNNLGVVCFLEQKFDKSHDYYSKAISIWKKYYNGSHSDIADYHFNIASIYIQKEEFEKAKFELSLALETGMEFYNPQHPFIAVCYMKFGEIARNEGDYDKAFEYIQMALEANRINRQILSDIDQLRILSEKALVYTDRYNFSSGNTSDLDSTVLIYKTVSKLIDDLRKSYKTKGSMLTLSQVAAEYYREAIPICYQLYKQSGNKKHIIDAFYFAEKNRANVLVETMLEYKSERASGILDSLLERKEELRSKLLLYEQELQDERFKKEKRDLVKIQDLEKKSEDINTDYIELINIFENNHKNYFDLRYNTQVITPEEVSESLPEGSTLIEYVLSDSVIYIFTINKINTSVIKKPLDSLDFRIKELREILAAMHISKIDDQVYNRYVESAYRLYLQLIQPVEDWIEGNRLIIVPDGKLGYIPFEVLLTGKATKTNFKDLSYLLKQYLVTYANSATIQFNLLPEMECRANNNFYGIAPFSEDTQAGLKAEMSNRFVLSPLPSTATEIESIKEMLGGDIYTGENAAKSNFLDEASKYKIIHIATHGIIDDEFPMESALFFYPTDSITDNKLTTSDLFGLRFHAEMVVLSACNTGYGKLNRGEGIMSLARGFSYAGVPSVTMSLWSINDKSTAIIMHGFYKYLKKGYTKDNALRQAKLDYISQSDQMFANPYYWGGFVFIGRNDVVDLGTERNTYLYLLLLIPVGFLVSSWWRKRSGQPAP